MSSSISSIPVGPLRARGRRSRPRRVPPGSPRGSRSPRAARSGAQTLLFFAADQTRRRMRDRLQADEVRHAFCRLASSLVLGNASDARASSVHLPKSAAHVGARVVSSPPFPAHVQITRAASHSHSLPHFPPACNVLRSDRTARAIVRHGTRPGHARHPRPLQTPDRSHRAAPIALVSTINAPRANQRRSVLLLSGVGSNPMTLLFCPATSPDGTEKDSLANAKPTAKEGARANSS